ncbi:transcriptional regulator BetI [Serratia entomophila]|jgi:TetR/AcrR family transcriptional repressor of bet genes|uniref:HTH-type transcriptional regulator BetI n=1 Tax=Serratia entomophila TaxID=42906 RepID=A0ABY5CPV3_9GAMM|nr:transcriptional regulator BetI [Serratia entomophila]UIW17573.1 transcriptional regulator BetI [Serratia entomophila]USV00136.1 transcriptional regulator BetI [Serratia entomophila]CAI0700125.1 transcriptional regulator BetI [Serratia entomophila]CAI0776363.1 transcriptional regulator BetI [Serratia entomophila]CAI0866394.1 transcriptional regulator BetI [Serratia entomophila]
MYRKDIPEQRKEQLINAAFETINVVGLAGVTLSQVAKEAGLSTGIVSHYFGDKDGLLNATMRKILRDLRDAVAECRARAAGDSQSQLFAIIQGNFHPSQTNAVSMRAWLDFWAASMHQPALRRLQRANDRRLYSNICSQFRRALPQQQAREAARGLAAMIDGLWLRGSLAGNETDLQQDCRLACDYVTRILNAAQPAEKPSAKAPRR